VYHFFVRRRLRQVMARLSAGDFAFVRRQFHPAATHWFSGAHALSGRRSSPSGIEAWYQRLASVFPGITFAVQKIIVSGPPWDTVAAIEWVDEIHDRRGERLPNEGVFTLRLRWGKAVDFRVFCDTSRLEKNLARLAGQGVDEAALAPIVG
jgi:ketosteroid isomerase-like protein